MTDWRSRSTCKDVDPDLFFPDAGPLPRSVARICQRCPVLITCTFDALRRNDLGYQAGLSKAERDRIRRWDRAQRARMERSAS
ncbi:WhiB family transcriptional regulator [Nonomuraea sp. GTA35]|uniref:WhiB family transcriptional regulator n=1 Tax=Nonomuraea sp. GTA35 TaxID=1676746 RepID=UPI0035BF8B47